MVNLQIMASDMKMILLIAVSGIMLSAPAASAQTQFITKGNIVYEKRLNQHKGIE